MLGDAVKGAGLVVSRFDVTVFVECILGSLSVVA